MTCGMKKIIKEVLLTLVFFSLMACDHSGGTYSDEILLSSELFGSATYYVRGYLFEEGEFINYPGTDGTPDILAENFRQADGSIVAAGFSSPGNSAAFLLKGTYNSESEATDVYTALTVADTVSTYQEITDTLRINQVWLFRTVNGHYAKMQIKDIAKVTGSNQTVHFEIQFQYRYQPEDSPLLGE